MKRFSAIAMTIVFLLSACAKQVTGDDVVAAFKSAGLEAENPTAMAAASDYGPAPFVCKGTHFFIPSLDAVPGDGSGGRIFVCDNDKDRDSLKHYYDELGKSSALFFSWTFVKGNILVQINGDLPEDKARQYEAAIP